MIIWVCKSRKWKHRCWLQVTLKGIILSLKRFKALLKMLQMFKVRLSEVCILIWTWACARHREELRVWLRNCPVDGIWTVGSQLAVLFGDVQVVQLCWRWCVTGLFIKLHFFSSSLSLLHTYGLGCGLWGSYSSCRVWLLAYFLDMMSDHISGSINPNKLFLLLVILPWHLMTINM